MSVALIPDKTNSSKRGQRHRQALARELESSSDFASLAAAPYRGIFRGLADLSVREVDAGSDSR